MCCRTMLPFTTDWVKSSQTPSAVTLLLSTFSGDASRSERMLLLDILRRPHVRMQGVDSYLVSMLHERAQKVFWLMCCSCSSTTLFILVLFFCRVVVLQHAAFVQQSKSTSRTTAAVVHSELGASTLDSKCTSYQKRGAPLKARYSPPRWDTRQSRTVLVMMVLVMIDAMKILMSDGKMVLLIVINC